MLKKMGLLIICAAAFMCDKADGFGKGRRLTQDELREERRRQKAMARPASPIAEHAQLMDRAGWGPDSMGREAPGVAWLPVNRERASGQPTYREGSGVTGNSGVAASELRHGTAKSDVRSKKE